MNILVVAAHPDDEALGCGGTVARLAAEGHAVSIAILGQGATSRDGLGADEAERLVTALRGQCREAGRLLGAAEVFPPVFPDNRFDTLPLLDLVKHVEKIVDAVRPDTVYTHHGGDLNIDHVLTFRAVLTALRPMAGSGVSTLYSFEIPSSTDWAFGSFEPAFRPDTFVDITATLEQKLRGLAVYESEGRPFPHPRSEQALTALAQVRGSTVGLAAAEAFVTVFSLR